MVQVKEDAKKEIQEEVHAILPHSGNNGSTDTGRKASDHHHPAQTQSSCNQRLSGLFKTVTAATMKMIVTRQR